MLRLADEVFAVRTDPNQLDVNDEVLERLYHLHPATLNELDDGNGPVAWVLVIPTSYEIMNRFLSHEITEKQLLDETESGSLIDVVYLCSALVLDEYRRQGIAKQLCIEAIEKIREEHPLKALFAWTFTKEGGQLAETVSKEVKLPLFKR
jgi:GNAT superfamily N-acetyltransferase